ncbi:hypothetical protein BC827DRAFT_1157828 [Russula dissimulans]|nr:hypothetical protein BC827DRAFT_1157828 [Russula dissimulans]
MNTGRAKHTELVVGMGWDGKGSGRGGVTAPALACLLLSGPDRDGPGSDESAVQMSPRGKISNIVNHQYMSTIMGHSSHFWSGPIAGSIAAEILGNVVAGCMFVALPWVGQFLPLS